MLCSDVELNPGPNKKRGPWFIFSICYWYWNSLTSHTFEKVNFLEAYNTVNKFDIRLSESFLDSSILTENNNLKTGRYKMVKDDDPNNVKRGGVCTYIRESLSLQNFSNSNLSKCFTLEVTISNKRAWSLLYITLLVKHLMSLTHLSAF